MNLTSKLLYLYLNWTIIVTQTESGFVDDSTVALVRVRKFWRQNTVASHSESTYKATSYYVPPRNLLRLVADRHGNVERAAKSLCLTQGLFQSLTHITSSNILQQVTQTQFLLLLSRSRRRRRSASSSFFHFSKF